MAIEEKVMLGGARVVRVRMVLREVELRRACWLMVNKSSQNL